MDLREINKRQATFQFHADGIPFVPRQAIPLIHRNHQGTTRFEYVPQKMQVLLYDAVSGIHHQNHNVCIRNGIQGFDHGKLFDGFLNLAAPPHASGID